MDDDHSLIAKVLNGEAERFADLINAYQARVRLACLTLLGNATEADDAAQDTFLKAFRNLSQFRGESSFQTWVLNIARNHCLDILRHRRTQTTVSIDALLERHGDAVTALLQGVQPDEQASWTREEQDLLASLWAALPEEDRVILTMREIEELPYDAIARRLQCSLDAVKGRLKRARQLLIEKFANYL